VQETEKDTRRVGHELIQRGSCSPSIQDQVNDEGSQDFHKAKDVLSLKVGALDELVEARDPQVPREGQAEQGERMYEGVVLIVLSYIAH
jgi:hypothetical protein